MHKPKFDTDYEEWLDTSTPEGIVVVADQEDPWTMEGVKNVEKAPTVLKVSSHYVYFNFV